MHDAERVHEELVSIAIERNRLDVRQARLLVLAEELELWRRFDCAHMFEYLERYCDLQPRTAREYVRVSRALAALPVTRAALESEGLRYSAARELTRIMTPQTEAEWLRATAGMTAREIEDEVAGRERGDRPHDPKDPDRLVTLSLQVRESTYAMFVHARMQYTDEAGERLSDDEVVVAMCRASSSDSDSGTDAGAAADTADGLVADETDGSTPDWTAGAACVGEPAYQLSITTCRACRRSFQLTPGRELEVSAAMLAMARCDARHIGDLESEVPQRALKSVTPRMREQVFARDNYACTVPGCRSKRCLDIHHIQPQSEGGPNTASNLTTLCWGHHRQHHEHRLSIRGQAPDRLAFTWPTDPARTSTRDASR